MAAAKTFTPKDVANQIGTDGKTLRKFLRTTFPEHAPGKGNRWALTSKQVKEVKKGFAEWDQKRRAPKPEPEATDEVEVDEVEDDHDPDMVDAEGNPLYDDYDEDFDSGELPDVKSLDQVELEHDIDN